MFTYTNNIANTKLKSSEYPVETKVNNELDPRRDSILDPHRFETVWAGIQEKVVFIKKSMGIGREAAVLIEEDLEIFASHVPSNYQIAILDNGIKQHSLEYDKMIEKSCSHLKFVLKEHGKPVAGIYGYSYQSDFTIVCFMLTKADINLAIMIWQDCIKQLNSSIENIYLPVLPNDEWVTQTISALGFHDIEERGVDTITAWATVNELKTALEKLEGSLQISPDVTLSTQAHEKEIEFEAGIMQFALQFSPSSDSEVKEDMEDKSEQEPAALKDRFMFLVQSEDKQIAGGILCEVEETYLSLEHLWLHETMREKSFSKKLMHLAEEHGKQKGCITAVVGTSSYQAPWLYPKLGYKQVFSCPLGPYVTYNYKKNLKK